MSALLSTPQHWHTEYARKGIPSSFRDEPSGSVVAFVTYLHTNGLTNGTALDIGCGTGRNSVFLASLGFRVVAFDFEESIITEFRRQLSASNLSSVLRAECHDVSQTWPVEDESVDVAIDTFCFKHQIPLEHRLTYRSELQRTLKPGGYFLLTLAGDDDGYYSRFLASETDEKVIVDPANEIPSMLYSYEDICSFFSPFGVASYEKKEKPSLMHGKPYDRTTHVFVLQKDCT
jgi:SAM-dependent methyltransferase